MSALGAFHLAGLTIKILSKIWSQESSKLFFDTIKKKSLIYLFLIKPGLPQKTQRPNYILHIDGHDENTSKEFHPVTVIDHFKQI